MPRPPSLLAAALGMAGSLALPAGARSQVATFGARSELVVLSATAVDGKGRPVTDLRREEFRVFEEGRPQPIVHFHDAREVPARVLMLVDASGSMGASAKVASVTRAAEVFLDELASEDQVALAGFDSRYFGLVAFTRDREAVRARLRTLEQFGSTALHDALGQAASDLASHGPGRRAVVVITDGVDTASAQSPDAVLERSRALDVPIYALSVVSPLDDPESPRYLGERAKGREAAGAETLVRYSSLSGGAAFRASSHAALRQAAFQIARELKFQYRLGYDPPAGPESFRRVDVRATRKGVTVRTRSGYVPSRREAKTPAGGAGSARPDPPGKEVMK